MISLKINWWRTILIPFWWISVQSKEGFSPFLLLKSPRVEKNTSKKKTPKENIRLVLLQNNHACEEVLKARYEQDAIFTQRFERDHSLDPFVFDRSSSYRWNSHTTHQTATNNFLFDMKPQATLYSAAAYLLVSDKWFPHYLVFRYAFYKHVICEGHPKYGCMSNREKRSLDTELTY